MFKSCGVWARGVGCGRAVWGCGRGVWGVGKRCGVWARGAGEQCGVWEREVRYAGSGGDRTVNHIPTAITRDYCGVREMLS